MQNDQLHTEPLCLTERANIFARFSGLAILLVQKIW